MTALLLCKDPSLRCFGVGLLTIERLPRIVHVEAIAVTPAVDRDAWALERALDDQRCGAVIFDRLVELVREHADIAAAALEVATGVPHTTRNKRLPDGRVIKVSEADADAAAKQAVARTVAVNALRIARPELRPMFVSVGAGKLHSTGSKSPGRAKRGEPKPDTKALVRDGVRRILGAAACDTAMRHLSTGKAREAAYDALSVGIAALRESPELRRMLATAGNEAIA